LIAHGDGNWSSRLPTPPKACTERLQGSSTSPFRLCWRNTSRFTHASEHTMHDYPRNGDWCAENNFVWPTNHLKRLRICVRSGRCADVCPPFCDAEPPRRSSWNYPSLERSAALREGQMTLRDSNRKGFEYRIMPVLQQSCAASTARAKSLCHFAVWTTPLDAAQRTSERVQRKIVRETMLMEAA